MAKAYIGPGGQNVAFGNESDKWVEINAKSATIDTFKGVGNASTPVYFDENGVPKPVTSSSGSGGSSDSGGDQDDIGLSIVDGEICVTYNE